MTLQFLDQETRRGVPMVVITTTNDVVYVSDSNGVIAVNEPGLEIFWVRVQCDGYSLLKSDDFDGIAIQYNTLSPLVLFMKRSQLAERLYRVTGEGIYRDSFITKTIVPAINFQTIKDRFLSNAKITGQDSVMNAIYRGKYYWFYGDTNSESRYLGNFHASGAISNIEDLRNYSLSISPNITYFKNQDGFVKSMAPMQPLNLPTWIHAIFVNESKMLGTFMKPDKDMNIIRRGFIQWCDQLEQFELVSEILFDIHYSFPIDGSHIVTHKGGEKILDGWIYFGQPFPLVRTKNYLDLGSYQSFSPLKPNTNSYNLTSIQLDINPENGVLNYEWKSNTSPLSSEQMFQLVMMGKLKLDQALFLQLIDIQTGKLVVAHAGTVNFNEFRNRYILIVEQMGDSGSPSALGEIYYSEGDSPIGPFRYASKIVTHSQQDFYNPSHHVEFDEQYGRVIYFEGTYSNSFTNSFPTPRYNYNQQMYRLEIENILFNYPVPIRKCEYEDERGVVYTHHTIPSLNCQLEFHALIQPCNFCVPVYQDFKSFTLRKKNQPPIFYALKDVKEGYISSIHKELTFNFPKTLLYVYY